jgi:SAM-dependent methyltransferase
MIQTKTFMLVNKCYNCGETGSNLYDTENGFTLVKCRKCGLLYVKERPDDHAVSEAHKQGIHTGAKKLVATGAFDAGKISGYGRILKDLFGCALHNKRTWLDVGCGHGEFMVAVRKYSCGAISVRGTEPNAQKQISARNRGLDVSFFDLSIHEDKYDVVSLLNVWSHLPDPHCFLLGIKHLLNDDGELVIQTGDTAQFSAREHFKPYYLPDHLSFASEKIVTDIVRRCGFEVLNVRKYHCLPLRLKSICKEILKLGLPHYYSGLRYYLQWTKYSQTNMFLRVKLPSLSTNKS